MPARSSYWTIVGALLIAEIAAIFETTMIYVALPTLIREFGDPVTAGWLITSHGLIGTSAALMAGRLGDIYGRKRVLQIMLAIAIAGSILSAVTTDFLLVLLGRALQGCATALIPLSIGILRETLPKERLPVAIGLMTTGMGMGTATGLVLGGWIIDHYPWHTLFVVSTVMLMVAFAAIQAMIPANPGSPPRTPIDWIEGILPIPGITAVLLGISLSNTIGWLNATVIGLIVLGLAVMAYWALRSLRAAEPFINLRLLASRNVAVTIGLAVLLSLGTLQITIVFSAYSQNPTWTMAGLGLTATIAGLTKLPSNVLSILSGSLLAAFGWVLSLAFPTTIIQIVLLMCVISFGTTMLNAAIPNIIVASVPQERTSEAIGAMSVLRGMAQSIGSQVIAVMLAVGAVASAADGGAMMPSATGFYLTMGWIAALTLAAALLAFLLCPTAEAEAAREAEPAPG